MRTHYKDALDMMEGGASNPVPIARALAEHLSALVTVSDAKRIGSDPPNEVSPSRRFRDDAGAIMLLSQLATALCISDPVDDIARWHQAHQNLAAVIHAPGFEEWDDKR